MPERRSTRRATAKAVNYAKEQEFSDVDVFEDSPDEEAPKRSRGRARKSTSAGGTSLGDELHEDGVYIPPKPVFTEKGYDPALPPLRERFAFLPEFEPDGSPRIDLIVGRRPVDEKEGPNNGDDSDDDNQTSDNSSHSDEEQDISSRKKRPKRGSSKTSSPSKSKHDAPVEYEYLIKYKGRSYLHLEWRTGADLESMNKSAKTLYRRYLKKLASGVDEDLEDPNFDPSFAVPQRIIDVAEQEFTMELSDKELLEWEKEREKALAEEDSDEEVEVEGTENVQDKDSDGKQNPTDHEDKKTSPDESNGKLLRTADSICIEYPVCAHQNCCVVVKEEENDDMEDWTEEEIDFSTLSVDRLRQIVNKDGLYFPKFEGCDNPYRDGYVTEPPKKPRASYLLFQCTMRPYFQKRNPDASQGELMTILGDAWKTLTPEGQEPFIQLAKEEAKQYDKERLLLEKAQKPNEMWQPLRRCLMVLDRISNDGFASIFLEPVDVEEFTDYEEVVDQPMDLGTVRAKLTNKKYQAPEQFARDVRKVRGSMFEVEDTFRTTC